jgi:hypothetical protein
MILPVIIHQSHIAGSIGGRLVQTEVLWNLLATSKATGLMLIFPIKHGQMQQASMMFLFSTQDIGK